jgi:hypothetical protein
MHTYTHTLIHSPESSHHVVCMCKYLWGHAAIYIHRVHTALALDPEGVARLAVSIGAPRRNNAWPPASRKPRRGGCCNCVADLLYRRCFSSIPILACIAAHQAEISTVQIWLRAISRQSPISRALRALQAVHAGESPMLSRSTQLPTRHSAAPTASLRADGDTSSRLHGATTGVR